MAKSKEVEEIRDLSDDELKKALDEAYEDLFKLRFRQATRQLEKHQAVSLARKRIARIKTIQAQRMVNAQS